MGIFEELEERIDDLEKKIEKLENKRNVNGVICSFCDKDQSQVKKIIAGPDGVFICNECTALCHEIMCEKLDHEYTDKITETLYEKEQEKLALEKLNEMLNAPNALAVIKYSLLGELPENSEQASYIIKNVMCEF